MYDKMEGNQFIMVMSNNEVILNDRCKGLFYYDLENCSLVIVNTVEEKRERFSPRELSGARESRWELAMFGYQSHKTFEHMVLTIKNFPVKI